MKINKLEKVLVNSKKRAKKNIKLVERLFTQIDVNNIKKILEVGCGIGVISSYLAEKYRCNVVGIDLDSKQIKKAKKNNIENEYSEFNIADVTKLAFENKEFDIILSFDVLHHIPNWNQALHELSRVLKPEGFYIIHDIMVHKSFGKIYKNCGVFTSDNIIDHLKKNHFKVIYEEKLRKKFSTHFSIVLKKNLFP